MYTNVAQTTKVTIDHQYYNLKNAVVTNPNGEAVDTDVNITVGYTFFRVFVVVCGCFQYIQYVSLPKLLKHDVNILVNASGCGLIWVVCFVDVIFTGCSKRYTLMMKCWWTCMHLC